jgi:hypothetical protein
MKAMSRSAVIKLTKVAVRCWRFTIDRADGSGAADASFTVLNSDWKKPPSYYARLNCDHND